MICQKDNKLLVMVQLFVKGTGRRNLTMLWLQMLAEAWSAPRVCLIHPQSQLMWPLQLVAQDWRYPVGTALRCTKEQYSKYIYKFSIIPSILSRKDDKEAKHVSRLPFSLRQARDRSISTLFFLSRYISSLYVMDDFRADSSDWLPVRLILMQGETSRSTRDY